MNINLNEAKGESGLQATPGTALLHGILKNTRSGKTKWQLGCRGGAETAHLVYVLPGSSCQHHWTEARKRKA